MSHSGDTRARHRVRVQGTFPGTGPGQGDNPSLASARKIVASLRRYVLGVTSPDFDAYRKALRKHGFQEVDSQRDGAFGSWLIVFDDPRARLVWDGKRRLASR